MEPVTDLDDFEVEDVYDDEAFEAYPSSIHFGGGGPSVERSFLPGGPGRDRGAGAGGDADFSRRQRARRLAAAVRADADVAARSAALGSLFCEEEDVRKPSGGAAAAAAAQAKQEKDKGGKDKGKGKK